jgi:hypothetical protein
MVQFLRQFAIFLRRRMTLRLHQILRYVVTAAAMLFALVCSDGKLSLSGFESGSEEVVAVVQVAQPFQAWPRHVSEPVCTDHHHTRVLHVVRSLAESESNPTAGHRLANGLNAPLRS